MIYFIIYCHLSLLLQGYIFTSVFIYFFLLPIKAHLRVITPPEVDPLPLCSDCNTEVENLSNACCERVHPLQVDVTRRTVNKR